MSRGMGSFLRQVADELPGHLPPALRDYRSQQWGRFYKLWYGDRKIHFEVQFLSRRELQIGLHLEADEKTNDEVVGSLERHRGKIRKALGEEASVGSHGPKWRSVAESWRGGELTGEDAAVEVSARLAEYVRTLQPLLSQKNLVGGRRRD